MKLMKTGSMIVVAALALGCGGGGPSDGTLLTAVTDEEARALCGESRAESYTPTEEETCTLSALFSATTEAECATRRDECVAMEPMPTEMLDCDTVTNDEFASCGSATVGEFRACLAVLGPLYDDIYSRAVCSNAGTDEAPSFSELTMLPEECRPIMACGTEMM